MRTEHKHEQFMVQAFQAALRTKKDFESIKSACFKTLTQPRRQQIVNRQCGTLMSVGDLRPCSWWRGDPSGEQGMFQSFAAPCGAANQAFEVGSLAQPHSLVENPLKLLNLIVIKGILSIRVHLSFIGIESPKRVSFIVGSGCLEYATCSGGLYKWSVIIMVPKSKRQKVADKFSHLRNPSKNHQKTSTVLYRNSVEKTFVPCISSSSEICAVKTLTGWWFQIFCYFHPYLGKIPIMTNIFQMGWFNHQLDWGRSLVVHFRVAKSGRSSRILTEDARSTLAGSSGSCHHQIVGIECLGQGTLAQKTHWDPTWRIHPRYR